MITLQKKLSFVFIFSFVSFLAFSQTTNRPDALRLYNDGKYPEAIAICELEVQEKPNNLDSYCVLCWSLVKNKQYAEAEQWALKARTVSQYDHRIIEILGEAKFYLGKNAEALSLFQEYISYVPTNGARIGIAYELMGEIYIKQARYQHADIALTTAVRSEPLIASWWSRLGYAREMTENYQSSLEAYEKSLSLNANNYDAARGKERVSQKLR